MKKSTLALAVAAALAASAAYADTTLYGSARVSVDYLDLDNEDALSSLFDQEGNWDVVNNASRLGVRGSEDLGGGLSAIYQYEFGVDMTEGGNLNSNRPKWVGLKGGFGSITAGTQWTPYYNVIGIGDIFNSSRSFSADAYLGSTFGLRMDNSLIYSTPNFSGFKAEVMLVMNGSCEPATTNGLCRLGDNRLPANYSDSVDMWNISGMYKNGPFFAGVTYMALEGDNNQPEPPTPDGDQWGIALGYNAAPFSVSLSYEDGDVNVYPEGATSIYLTGAYTFGNNVIRGAYGYVDPETSRVDDINNYLLGYQYNFSKRTRVWVEYIGRSDEDFFGDQNAFSIGTRHDF